MYLHCTKKLIDELKLNKEDLVDFKDDINGEGNIFSWHANIILINRRKAIVFVNDYSKYAFMLYGVKAKELKNIKELFFDSLRRRLKDDCYKEEYIDKYIEMLGDIKFAKSGSRCYIGRLNKVSDAVFASLDFIDESILFQSLVSKHISRDFVKLDDGHKYEPVKKLNATAIYALLNDDGEYNKVFAYEVYQLFIQIKLATHYVYRTVVVPSSLTFEQLHEIIQIIFDWHDSHLHRFFILSNEKDNDLCNTYGRPLDAIIISQYEELYNEMDGDYNILDERFVRLKDFFEYYKTIGYRYDYGDNWEHNIVLEKTYMSEEEIDVELLDKHGTRPLEDVGGQSGYEEYLSIINDKNNPECESYLEWGEGQGQRDLSIADINYYLKKFNSF